MSKNISEYKFMPSEEARLILGYLYDLGLEKTAKSLLTESDALKEYRVQGGTRRNSGSRMLGLDLTQIFDGYYKQNYGLPEETIPKCASTVTLMCFKGTQTSNPSVDSVGIQTTCNQIESRGTQTTIRKGHSLGFQIEQAKDVQSVGIQATSLLGVPIASRTDNWIPMTQRTSPVRVTPNHSGISNFRRAVERQNERLSRGENNRTHGDVAQFLMDGDTFDLSSRIEDSMGASRRKSSQPRESLVGGHELSNSRFTPPIEAGEECLDAVLESIGNERILNDILGIRPDELESICEGEITPGFTSPNSSCITPRRVGLLMCTPSPKKPPVRPPRQKPSIFLLDPPAPFTLPGEVEAPFTDVTAIKRRGAYQKTKSEVPKKSTPRTTTRRRNSKK